MEKKNDNDNSMSKCIQFVNLSKSVMNIRIKLQIRFFENLYDLYTREKKKNRHSVKKNKRNS